MDFIEDSLRRLRRTNPDLAILIMAILNELAEIKKQTSRKQVNFRGLTQGPVPVIIGICVLSVFQVPLKDIVGIIKLWIGIPG